MKIAFDLIPLERVGPFRFGSKLNEYSHLPLKIVPEEFRQSVGWDVYTIENREVRIYFEKNVLIGVDCSEECIVGDKNIINIEYCEFEKSINWKLTCISEEDLDDGIRYIYEFDELGLLIYVKDKKIISVSCNGPSFES